jgi:hypothetical protein
LALRFDRTLLLIGEILKFFSKIYGHFLTLIDAFPYYIPTGWLPWSFHRSSAFRCSDSSTTEINSRCTPSYSSLIIHR